MKNKMRWWKKVLFAAAVLVLLTIITAVILFWRVIRTAASVETDIATNFYLTAGEKFGTGTEESHTRYEILDALMQSKEAFSMDDLRDALDSVSKHNFNSQFASTEWSIVYNQQTGGIRYYHREKYDKDFSFQLDME